MTARPLIGITTQTLHAIESVPADLPASWVMNQRYVHAVRTAGGVPVLIPLLADDSQTLRDLYDRLDGLLLPGGVDIDPAQYRTAPHPALGRLDPDRDAVELELARWAVADRKPLLGLCRGLQVLNVALGGTLWQDIASERVDSIKHDYYPTAGWSRDHLSHSVAVDADSRLGGSLASGVVAVNSMHHQGIRDLGRGLAATAVSPDGLIEAAEGTGDGYAVAVQWHPEMFTHGVASVGTLFEDFVEVAAAHR